MQRLSHHKINSSVIEFDNFNYKKFLWKKFFKASKIFPISVRTSKSQGQWFKGNLNDFDSKSLSEKNHLDFAINSIKECRFFGYFEIL